MPSGQWSPASVLTVATSATARAFSALGNRNESDHTEITITEGETGMRVITLDEAVKIINATFAEAKRRNAYPLTAVLLDAGGRMKAALKQDGASLLRFEVSYGKAYAALAMGRESRQVLQKAKDKPLFMQSFVELADGPMFLEGGGRFKKRLHEQRREVGK